MFSPSEDLNTVKTVQLKIFKDSKFWGFWGFSLICSTSCVSQEISDYLAKEVSCTRLVNTIRQLPTVIFPPCIFYYWCISAGCQRKSLPLWHIMKQRMDVLYKNTHFCSFLKTQQPILSLLPQVMSLQRKHHLTYNQTNFYHRALLLAM